MNQPVVVNDPIDPGAVPPVTEAEVERVQPSVSNAQPDSEPVTDPSNTPENPTTAEGTDPGQEADAEASTESGDQPDGGQPSAEPSTPSEPETTEEPTNPEIDEIRQRANERANRLANRLAQQGRERASTEAELEQIRQENAQLKHQNQEYEMRLQNPQSIQQPTNNFNNQNGQQDMNSFSPTNPPQQNDFNTQPEADGEVNQDGSGNQVQPQPQPANNGNPDPEVVRLRQENAKLRSQVSDFEASEGGFYETISDDPDEAAHQILHNQKLIRASLIEQGDNEKHRVENEQHRTAISIYTEQGIDEETAQQLVALDVSAIEAETPADRFKNLSDSKKLYNDAMSKAAEREETIAEQQRVQDEARRQQLADRQAVASPNGQGASPPSEDSPLESTLKNMADMTYNEKLDYIEELESKHTPDFIEEVMMRFNSGV